MNDEMTVGELTDLLQWEPDDAVVRVVHQRSWPLQETVGGIANVGDLIEGEPDEQSLGDSGQPTVYLVATGHPEGGSPYGSRSAWDVMRRGRT
jgi:hypothetical protein